MPIYTARLTRTHSATGPEGASARLLEALWLRWGQEPRSSTRPRLMELCQACPAAMATSGIAGRCERVPREPSPMIDTTFPSSARLWHRSELASGGSANDRRARVPGQGAGTRMAGAGAERQQGRGRGRAAPARDYMAQGSPGQGAQAGRGFQRSHGKGAGRGIVAREFKGEKSVN